MSTALIQNWTKDHEKAVEMYCLHFSPVEVAKALSCSVVTINNYLRHPRAQQQIQLTFGDRRRAIEEKIGNELSDLAAQSISNISETVYADRKSVIPKAVLELIKHQDYVGLELLSRVGFVKQDKPTVVSTPISGEAMQVLVDALRKSEEVERVHGVGMEVPVQEEDPMPST